MNEKFDIVEFANDMLSSMAKVRDELKESLPDEPETKDKQKEVDSERSS